MNINFNPYDLKSPSRDYGTHFNVFHFYVEFYKAHPDVYEFGAFVHEKTLKNLLEIGAERIFLCEMEKIRDEGRVIEPNEACYKYEDALIIVFKKESILGYSLDYQDPLDPQEPQEVESTYKCRVLYQKPETLEKIKTSIEVIPVGNKQGKVYLLCTMDGMLALQKFDIKLPSKDIDLDLNYGSEAAEKFEKINKHLSKNKNGLILFSGEPGTGKSTFIKYLTTKTTRKVIYLSSGAMEQLTNPDFLSFMMSHRNSILLLEDAEKVLRSRDSRDNEAISNILNITDGILGDCLNIMVIATFNIEREKIDSALVRKGRLFIEHHFKALPVENCNKILEGLKVDRKADGPMTLAEIFNEEDNYHEEEEERKVGF